MPSIPQPAGSPAPSEGVSAPSATPRPKLWSRAVMNLVYDALVVHGTYWAWWGVRWPIIASLYRNNVGKRHLELAPGTGFFLNKIPAASIGELHLLDLHEGPLEVSAQRLAHHDPTIHVGDVFHPFPLGESSVDSVAAGMLLHCLPGGTIPAKTPVFDNVAAVLRPGGKFIGTTVLATGRGITRSRFGERGLALVNDKKVFDNLGDDLSDLTRELEARFDNVKVVVRGSTALWEATAR